MAEAQVFVKIDGYKDVVDIVGMIRHKIDEAKKTLSRIHELKSEEDSELGAWSKSIGEIERKIDMIDRSLFEPQNL